MELEDFLAFLKKRYKGREEQPMKISELIHSLEAFVVTQEPDEDIIDGSDDNNWN